MVTKSLGHRKRVQRGRSTFVFKRLALVEQGIRKKQGFKTRLVKTKPAYQTPMGKKLGIKNIDNWSLTYWK